MRPKPQIPCSGIFPTEGIKTWCSPQFVGPSTGRRPATSWHSSILRKRDTGVSVALKLDVNTESLWKLMAADRRPKVFSNCPRIFWIDIVEFHPVKPTMYWTPYIRHGPSRREGGNTHDECYRTTGFPVVIPNLLHRFHLLLGLETRVVRRSRPRIDRDEEGIRLDEAYMTGSIARPVQPYTNDCGHSNLARAEWKCFRRARTLVKSGRANFGKAGVQSTPAASS